MLELTSFQAKLLATFFSDVAKGALLTALGFPIVVPLSWELRVLSFTGGLVLAVLSLDAALRIAEGVLE